jgi:hypothetical protein
MIEKLIQIIKIPPVFIPGIQISILFISLIKRVREPTEQLCHGQVSLRMPIIHSGIDQPAFSVISGNVVPCPEIPMQKIRPFRLHKIQIKMGQKILNIPAFRLTEIISRRLELRL